MNLVVFASKFATTLPSTLMTASSQNKSTVRDGSRIENRVKNVQKLTSPLMNNDSIIPEGDTMFSDASSDAIPLPTLLIAASHNNSIINDGSSTETTTENAQKLSNLEVDIDHMDNDSNTPFSDACSDSSPLPSLPEVLHFINTNNNTAAMTTGTSTNGPKLAEFSANDDHTKTDRNMQLSETPDIDIDDVSVIAPSHTNIAHSTKPLQRQIDIRTVPAERWPVARANKQQRKSKSKVFVLSCYKE